MMFIKIQWRRCQYGRYGKCRTTFESGSATVHFCRTTF